MTGAHKQQEGGAGKGGAGTAGLADQATVLDRDLKAKASDPSDTVTHAAKDQAAELGDAAKGAADAIGQVAAQYMREAAGQIEAVANAVRERDISGLLGELQEFARRQPTLFFGGAMVLGFAALRFFMVSAPDSSGTNPLRRRVADADAKHLMSEIDARITDLRKEALEEKQPFSATSEKDLRLFLGASPVIKRPSVYLIDNGNLRAVWRDTEGAQLGLQFLGEGEVQFVIFARRAEAPRIARSAGRDSAAGIRKQIASFELQELIYA